MPRCCRASCRSATSTRTRSSSPSTANGAEALELPERWRGSSAACCWRGSCCMGRALKPHGRRAAPDRALAGVRARARRRSRAPDRRHDDAAGDWAGSTRSCRTELDEYWQLTLDFLKIARATGRPMLEERGAIEPAARRDLLIEAERSGSHARRPGDRGGLDRLDAGDREAARDHRDAAARRRGAARARHRSRRRGLEPDRRHATERSARSPAIRSSPCTRCCGASASRATRSSRLGDSCGARARVVSEAMRPAAATERWARARSMRRRATRRSRSIAVIEAAQRRRGGARRSRSRCARRCTTKQDRRAGDAGPRAGAPRRRRARALEHRGGRFRRRRAARHRGRRVRAARRRGRARGPAAGEAAGAAQARALPARRSGRRACARDRGAGAGDPARAAAAAGAAGLAHALATFRARDAASLRSAPRLEPMPISRPRRRWSSRSAAALAPLEVTCARHHLPRSPRCMPRPCRRCRATMPAARWHSPAIDGAELARAFEEIAEQRDDFPVVAGRLCGPVRDRDRGPHLPPRRTPGARVRILGPLEARLVSVDRVVLGALVEGVWPPETRSDPWLSRPMRLELGLDLPERRVGLSAHDFAQLLGTPEVILTRAAKLGGAPTVASRFTQRLAAVAGETHWKARARAAKNISPGRAISTAPKQSQPAKRPRPMPPLEARPKRPERHRDRALAARSLHDLRQAYSRSSARSTPVDTPPGARDRGTVIHGAIGEFTENYAKALPADPLAALLALGERAFRAAAGFSGGARVLVAALPAHRALVRRMGSGAARQRDRAACRGARRARHRDRHAHLHADRRAPTASSSCATARFAILDYKTGSTPTEKQVRTGLSPQLTLEGAILRAGRFQGRAPADRSASSPMWRCAAASRRARTKPIEFKDGDAGQHADRALAKLKGILARFADARRALSLAGQPDVEDALWRLRPSGAREGMVGRRRGGGELE